MLKAVKVNKSVFINRASTLSVLILLKITIFLVNLQKLMHVKLAKILDLSKLILAKIKTFKVS